MVRDVGNDMRLPPRKTSSGSLGSRLEKLLGGDCLAGDLAAIDGSEEATDLGVGEDARIVDGGNSGFLPRRARRTPVPITSLGD